MKYILSIFLLSLICNWTSHSQNYDFEEEFYFDAIVFKGNKPDSARVDVFVAIPNKLLNFMKRSNEYHAEFDIVITFTDSLNNVQSSININKSVITDDFSETQSAKAEFTKVERQLYLPMGNYKTRAILTDNVVNRDYEKSRSITLINYSAFDFVASSIMLVSSIEERDGNYIITPNISDNVAFLNDGYFAFFEIYNDRELDKVNVITEMIDNGTNSKIYSDVSVQHLVPGTNQCWIRIPADIKYGLQNNRLCLYFAPVNDKVTSADNTNNSIIAATQRTVKSLSFISNRIASSLAASIRQLRYVATDNEIDSISAGTTDSEKLYLFTQYWKRKDPTLHTERNEAMEEYYRRIDYANSSFKTYSKGEGWLSDKGHVYIVFGKPDNVDRTNQSFSDNKTYERWIYNNNRVFVFVDFSGFGDFRLYSPSMVVDKYEYE